MIKCKAFQIRKPIFVFCVLLMSMVNAYPQYQINHFTTDNGLPSNGVKGMQIDDSTGFLWIATEAGLVRYNGIGFSTFDLNTNPDFGSNRMVFVAKNTTGKIFSGTEGGNLLSIKENSILTAYRGENTARYNYNHYCAVAASEVLFSQCFKDPWPENIFSIQGSNIIPLSDTACAVLNDAHELYYYSTSTRQPQLFRNAPMAIKTVFKLGSELYCENNYGTFYYIDVDQNNYREVQITNSYGNEIKMKGKSQNLFWSVGMENPVLLQDQNAWVIEKGLHHNLQLRLVASGIPENTFFNCAQYKEKGNYLFLGSASKGIYIIHKNQLTYKGPSVVNINQPNSFYSQIELPDGNILTNIGIVGDALPHQNFNISDQFASTAYSISDNVIIYAKGDSVFRYNRSTFQKKFMFSTHINVTFGLTYSGKDLYFADQQGIGIIDKNDSLKFIRYFDEKAGVHLTLSNMIEISPGKIAIATCEGLLQFNTNTKLLDTLLKIPSVCIRELYKEGDYLFIGTYGGGYYVMKNGKLKAMPSDINRYLKYSHCFMKDDKGFCWISTNNGLFKVKMTDILDAYENNIPQIYYHYLGKEEGMQSTEMNGGCKPCALLMKNRNFSFPTMDGLLWFNPEKTNIELPSGKIYLDKMVVDGRSQNIIDGGTILLPENASKIDINLAVNAWCKKENLYVDYQLNRDKWLPSEVSSEVLKISFNNLGYGTHTLLIRKLNGFGINNYSYTTINFTIATPFYHQWWFRVLALVSLLGIGYLFFRWRLQQYEIREEKLSEMVHEKTMDLHRKNIQLEKNNDIKTRLISIINHDIITPLKFMTYTGKALTESKLAIKPEEQLEIISEITQTAKDMEMLSSQILSWIIYQDPDKRMQKEEFDLHQLVEMVFGVLKFSEKQKNTKLINEVPPHFVVQQYLEPLRVMLYNLVMNSFNFTREGTITVSSLRKEDEVIISVRDTGLGMSVEQLNNLMSDERIISSANVDNKKGTGLGYLIIKDLLKMMEGTLHVQSGKNKGTTVTVSLPEPEEHF